MSGLRAWLRRYTVATVILVLFVGFGSATAAEDRFTVDIDPAGEVVAGQGTGFGDGTWYYYANTDWWAQWFYDGPYDETAGKVVEVTLTVSILNPTFAKQSSVQAALNWTTPQWVSDSDTPEPPLPKDIGDLDQEESLIERRTIVPKIELTQTITITTTYEISAYCPEWVSIDIRGENIRVEGVIQHECSSTQDPMPPLGVRDFGDAPEGALAYPSSGIMGRFPTCVSAGSATWIEHNTQAMYFGPRADTEPDGNGGVCPAFNPNVYNKDEGMMDGDAGLIDPRSYTISGSAGSEQVYPLVFFGLESLGATCFSGIWGANIDIEVHNRSTSDEAYVNLLVDWDQNGRWQGAVPCELGEIPEHAVVNFPVPAGYNGPLSGLNPPSFTIGPYAGYVWARFTMTEKPVPEEKWTGDGVYADGETEDYLLYVREAPSICEWNEGDSHTMHWAQLPNLWNTGLTVDMFTTGTDADSYEASLADDFRCTETSKLASVHFWGSFVDDLRPSRGIDSMTFQVNVYANQPADNLVDWDRPGELLWTAEVPRFDYDVSEVSTSVFQGWFDPKSGYFEEENHRRVYQFNICFDPEDIELFVQQRDTVYWLEIKKLWDENTNGYVFGWKTTRRPLQWNASAVWPHPTLGWLPMAYPEEHPYEGELLDLAFVTTGQSLRSLDFGDAPDPSYPTLAENDGAYHVIDKDVYLGKSVDAEVDGQPSAVGTGDDTDGTDDEDGVVFISTLVPGDVATVEVVASIQGALNAWIDFNGDGDWSDAGEQIAIDTTLSAGINYLTFDVPGKAVAGPTMSRWRFSRSRGLSYDGPAPDGEVEDHVVTIEEGLFSGFFPLAQVTWSQPPIEWDPSLGTPVYCGWNQPAYASTSSTSPSVAWKVVADNFRSLPGTPVTSVHWWGSYTAWEGTRRPDVAPDSWRIGFWSNVPAGSAKAFDRPGKLLWLVKAEADRVQEASAGLDEFPDEPSDTCFQYSLELEPYEYFWHDQLVAADGDDPVVWISITAVYSQQSEPSYAWGWKTRPQPWPSGAVAFSATRDDLRAGMEVDSSNVEPITNSLVCERLDMYDMAFALNTDPAFIKWEQPFTGVRHWEYYADEESLATIEAATTTKWAQGPDLTSAGMAVDATDDIPTTWPAQVAADDFQCTSTGPITGMTLWGAWYHEVLPGGDATDVTFTLSVRADIPAKQSGKGHNMPGAVLWRKEFKPGQFTVERQETRTQSYYSPANEAFEQGTHDLIFKYHFDIDAKEAFEQRGSAGHPTVYWLSVQADLVHSPGTVATRFGWSASQEHFNDAAVWARAEEPYSGTWDDLTYPKGHPLAGTAVDLAFEIETEEDGAALTYRRLVADDWRCRDAGPVKGMTWWGSYIGYGYQACECDQMARPQRPDYFLLSIWTDAPSTSAAAYGRPGRKVWEYRADDFDEVLVGADQYAGATDSDTIGFEPVYRYTVTLPQDAWFCQENAQEVYWLSIAAVYEDPKAMTYSWGWTNHPHGPWDLPDTEALAHWKLDESTGKTAADSSGNDNTATLAGDPVWRPEAGWFGGAIDLDGSGDYLKVANPVGFDFAPGSFSVSAWVYPRQTKGRWQAIMEYDRDSANGNRFGLWIDNQGRFHFRVGLNTWHSTESLEVEQWHLLAATYNGDTHEMMIYVNGLLDAAAVNSKGFVSPVKSALTIGVRGDESDEFFDGLLDDVRVFATTLSDADVLTLLGAGRNDAAVAGQFNAKTELWEWTELYDRTGAGEDVSFMLLTGAESCVVEDKPGQDDTDQGGDKEVKDTDQKSSSNEKTKEVQATDTQTDAKTGAKTDAKTEKTLKK